MQHHWDHSDAPILSDSAASGGGYFKVVALEPTQYQVFYTWMQDGRWHAANTGFAFNPKESTLSMNSGVPGDLQEAGQDDWFSMIAGVNPATVAVLSYAQRGAGVLPFSMVQIGGLPVWVCRYPTQISMPAYFVGLDNRGNVLWSTKM